MPWGLSPGMTGVAAAVDAAVDATDGDVVVDVAAGGAAVAGEMDVVAVVVDGGNAELAVAVVADAAGGVLGHGDDAHAPVAVAVDLLNSEVTHD